MSQISSSSSRWFQAYTPQQYTHYLKIKCLSEWAHCTYEKIYVRLDNPVPNNYVNKAISSGKRALKFARQLREAAENYPSQLRHLMKLDWEHCIKSCMTIHDVIKGNTKEEIKILELERRYIAQKSQYVDKDDLDMRLNRSSNAFSELGWRLANREIPNANDCDVILNDASKPLDIDLEIMISQILESIDHMNLKNTENNFNVYFIKNYDERFAMQRKAIKYLRELMKSLRDSEGYEDELDLAILSDSETIPKEVNYLDRCSSKILMDALF